MLPSVSAAFLVPRPGDAKPSSAALIDFTASKSVADLNRLLYDGIAAAGYAGGTAMESFAEIFLPVHLPRLPASWGVTPALAPQSGSTPPCPSSRAEPFAA